MSTFDQREESFEKRFAHDEERQFRAEARRNKLLGLWAAEKLGKSEAEARAYADGLVAAEVNADASEWVFLRVKQDLPQRALTSPIIKFAAPWKNCSRKQFKKFPQVSKTLRELYLSMAGFR